jgi:hypothetical protein
MLLQRAYLAPYAELVVGSQAIGPEAYGQPAFEQQRYRRQPSLDIPVGIGAEASIDFFT